MQKELGYDPKLFGRLGREKHLFQACSPEWIKTFLQSLNCGNVQRTGQLRSTSEKAQSDLGYISHALQNWYNYGGDEFKQFLYEVFTRSNGLRKLEQRSKSIYKDVPLLSKELTPHQLLRWNIFFFQGNVPRELALAGLQQIQFPNPDLLTAPHDPLIEPFYRKMRSIPSHYAVTLFPDLTDLEASQLFAQKISANEVRLDANRFS